MAVNKIRVNTERLNTTNMEVRQRIEKIKSDMEKISEHMESMNSMWTGEAHDAFAAQVTSDIQYLTEVCEALDGIGAYEEKAVKEYNKCEENVAELIAKIKI